MRGDAGVGDGAVGREDAGVLTTGGGDADAGGVATAGAAGVSVFVVGGAVVTGRLVAGAAGERTAFGVGAFDRASVDGPPVEALGAAGAVDGGGEERGVAGSGRSSTGGVFGALVAAGAGDGGAEGASIRMTADRPRKPIASATAP